jgi:hypothetical protein
VRPTILRLVSFSSIIGGVIADITIKTNSGLVTILIGLGAMAPTFAMVWRVLGKIAKTADAAQDVLPQIVRFVELSKAAIDAAETSRQTSERLTALDEYIHDFKHLYANDQSVFKGSLVTLMTAVDKLVDSLSRVERLGTEVLSPLVPPPAGSDTQSPPASS